MKNKIWVYHNNKHKTFTNSIFYIMWFFNRGKNWIQENRTNKLLIYGKN